VDVQGDLPEVVAEIVERVTLTELGSLARARRPLSGMSTLINAEFFVTLNRCQAVWSEAVSDGSVATKYSSRVTSAGLLLTA
jgi:hypothetical protein